MAQISTKMYYNGLYKTKVADKLINLFVDNLTLFLKTKSYSAYLTDTSYTTLNVVGKYNSELLYIKTYHSPLYNNFQTILDMQSADLIQAFDVLSEKISALGLDIPHTYQEFSSVASISQEIHKLTLKEVTERLIQDHNKMIEAMDNLLELADSMNDMRYKPLLEERIQSHTKHIEKLSKFLSLINNSSK